MMIRKGKGQSTIELTLVIGAVFLFLLGAVRTMGWFNRDMAARQGAYLVSRIPAGGTSPGTPISYSTPRLSVLREEAQPGYSAQEMTALEELQERDPGEILAALEELEAQVQNTNAPFTNTFLSQLNQASQELQDNPEILAPLTEYEGFDSRRESNFE